MNQTATTTSCISRLYNGTTCGKEATGTRPLDFTGELVPACKRHAEGQEPTAHLDPSQLHLTEQNLYVQEASQLGWAPGHWPQVVEVTSSDRDFMVTFTAIPTRLVFQPGVAGSDNRLGQTWTEDGDLLAQDYISRLGGFYPDPERLTATTTEPV